MTTINQLSKMGSVSVGDLLAAFSASTGDADKVSMSDLISYLESNIVLPATDYLVQVEYKTATGYSIQVADSGPSVWLIVRQAADYAAGTIVLPSAPSDHQEVLLTIENQVTTLTIDGGDYTVVNAPTSAYSAFPARPVWNFMFVFNTARSLWYTRDMV